MNYVKLSLALLVIGASSAVLAVKKNAAKAEAAAASEEAEPKKGPKAKKDAKSDDKEDAKGKKTTKKGDKAEETPALTKDPVGWVKAQKTSVKVGLGVTAAGLAYGAAYYFIPEVKKATHKAIDKAKAFANEAIENPEGSTARRNAIIAGLAIAGGAAVIYKWDYLKSCFVKESEKDKKDREAKEAKDAKDAKAKAADKKKPGKDDAAAKSGSASDDEEGDDAVASDADADEEDADADDKDGEEAAPKSEKAPKAEKPAKAKKADKADAAV
jgi:hypothetical protein